MNPGYKPGIRELAAVCAVILLVNLPVLDDFVRLVRLDAFAGSSSDAATHYFRIVSARDLYLPSGHHWGWEPYWFQGYVPFLLYPHLTYVLLAVAASLLPVEPFRIFNVYTLLLHFAFPLLGSALILRRAPLSAAMLAAAWLGTMTALGAGLVSLFSVGLLSQQAGMILFIALCYDLLMARRLDRAAVWLGLIPLVHIHTALVAGVVWCLAGLFRARKHDTEPGGAREWMTGTAVATAIALPSIVAMLHGWNSVGPAASYAEGGRLLTHLARGKLVAPLGIVAAFGVGLVAVLRSSAARDRETVGWVALALVLLGLGFHKWDLGLPLLNRISSTMMFLRGLAYGYVLLVFLVAARWKTVWRPARTAIALLTVWGVVQSWDIARSVSYQIGVPGPAGSLKKARSMLDYQELLDWVAVRSRDETTTMSVSVGKPIGLKLYTAVDRCRQPILTGHGAELTKVHNIAVALKDGRMNCDLLKRRIRDYAMGYLVGGRDDLRIELEKCLHSEPAYRKGDWWVFATGESWGRSPTHAAGFSHDPTWTELRWRLKPGKGAVRMRLPVASTAPWIADVDGKVVEIVSTFDRMMQVTLPENSRLLRLRYEGFAGEWESVSLAGVGLLVGVLRTRRRSVRAGASDAER